MIYVADSILLAGAGARLAFSIGAANHASGPVTFVCVVKQTAGANWESLIGDWEPDFQDRLGISDADNLFCTIAGTDCLSTVTVPAAGTWMIVGMTKATGTVAPRFHLYNGTSWTHCAGLTALANGATMDKWKVCPSRAATPSPETCSSSAFRTQPFLMVRWTPVCGYAAWQAANFTEGVRCDAASGLTSWTAGSMAQTSATGVTLDTGDAPSWWDDSLTLPPTDAAEKLRVSTCARW